MTIKTQYRFFLQKLQAIYNMNEAGIVTSWVFEKLANITKADLVSKPEQEIEATILTKLNEALAALLLHQPIQYVTGEAWFYRMKLKVNPHVLIPRPETEELVEWVSEHIAADCSLLDIGTGSGCIAIALKKNKPAIVVTAIDVSSGALLVAKENAAEQATPIEFLPVDFLDEASWVNLPVFDIIVSNPPYIPVAEKEKMDANVTGYEPHQALFVPNNTPLLFYQKIANFGLAHLKPGGKIFMETHEDFAKETAALFTPHYKAVLIKKDLFGKERMVMASY